MSSMDSLYLEACSQGYLLSHSEFLNLYAYSKQVSHQQRLQETEFFKARTPIAYPTSRERERDHDDWLTRLHVKIKQELTGE